MLRWGHLTGGVLGGLWLYILALTFAVAMSFATGDPYRPFFWGSLLLGAGMGVALVYLRQSPMTWALAGAGLAVLVSLPNWGPVVTGLAEDQARQVRVEALTTLAAQNEIEIPPHLEPGRAADMAEELELDDQFDAAFETLLQALQGEGIALPETLDGSLERTAMVWRIFVAAVLGAVFGFSLSIILHPVPRPGALSRHEFEEAVIRFLTGFGYIFFSAIVLIPFYIMVMTSLKNKAELSQNPLDFSIDLSKGWDLFVSYRELFEQFNFGTYLINSAIISVVTVALTLAFAIPGAYAVARLRFKGAATFSRSILLIYMVPMIVLALPIYVVFSVTGLRNTMIGMILIYPVTTIPVALYMLQGYFRGLPSEVEEAGLMDGLSRLQVIWKITLPLSLPALASVSLYVFMIAWNEFLLAQILLDDPSIFTLPKGVYSLNNSEVSSQTLMAGAVVATVPIMLIFLFLERFMTKGLTAGSVKG